MKKIRSLLIGWVILPVCCFCNDSVIIKNRFVERAFNIGPQAFYTSRFINLQSGKNYSRSGSEEFYFAVNNQPVSGAGAQAAFSFMKKEFRILADSLQQLTIFLQGMPGTAAEKLDVQLIYQLYNEFPVIRKQICITNKANSAIAITNLEVERLHLEPINTQQTDIYSNYGIQQTWRPYKGNFHDAVLYVCHSYAKEGFMLGNEAPSVLKRTEVYTHNNRIAIGYTTIDDHYPFKKWIEPGETFRSSKTFIGLVKTTAYEDPFEGWLADFIRTGLGVQLFEKKELPFAFYNTWHPFRTNISDTLIRSIADGLEGTGTDILILDDGWQQMHGEWKAHPTKFPNGLKPVCDYIIKKGMRPGLWVSLASVNRNSTVFNAHPEWAIMGKDGQPAHLHTANDPRHVTMSLGSGYYDHMLQTLKALVKENKLAYLKLDFAIANSAYVLDYEKKGDYGYAGKTYRDHESSFYAIYERAMQLFDALHAAFPDLLIDCTYEVWGEYYINDFALLQHADYDWLTNYEADPPEGPINIRQMAWDRYRVIPTATNLIGNQLMYTDHYKYTFLSLASNKPILVGDPRSLPVPVKKWYAKWNNWFKAMDRKYQFTRFTQMANILPRATMNNWDGCYKFNTEKQGGVLFYYRNGSPETTRTFLMPLADTNVLYHVYDADTGKTIGNYSGKQLREKGLVITIQNKYEAKVIGIEKQK